MGEKEKLERFEIPKSLKTILEKLPPPEAVQVLEDIGKVAWVVDNNNNNNNTTASLLEDRFLNKLSTMPSKELGDILERKG